MATAKKQPTYAALQRELDDIIAWFESADFDLEEATTKYVRGLELVARIETLLTNAKVTVEKLHNKLGG